jgi:hypothetical protein
MCVTWPLELALEPHSWAIKTLRDGDGSSVVFGICYPEVIGNRNEKAIKTQ